MELVYVLVAVAVLVIGYFLFAKKDDRRELESRPERSLRKTAERERTPAKKPAPAQQVAPTAEPERAEEPEADEQKPRIEERASLHETTDIESLRRGLAKSRGPEGIFGKLRALFSGKKEIGPEIAEQIEEVLLSSDVGVETTRVILERVKEGLGKGDLSDPSKVSEALRAEAVRILKGAGTTGAFLLRDKPTVVLMVGVNGAGKTTTIGKLATKLKAEGNTCVLAAGDTFRAAAVQQLKAWGDRVGCEVVHGKDGADPGSVVFEAIKRSEATGGDVVLADTAGRLHTKSNLMNEMKKIAKTADKALKGAPHEILLVIDATNGQNALAQAKEFKEALPITGIVLTKLDGTAKGGAVLGICDALGLPVRFVGLGERPDDLHEFDPDAFVEALLGREVEADAA
jgi:fused signal recognition particle receptor